MVFEYLFNVFRLEKKPWDAFFLGMLYVSLGILLSLWLFPSNASVVSVLLVVMASLPLVYDALRFEEKKEIKLYDEVHILKHHEHLVGVILFLFLGFSVAFAIWYSVLPSSIVDILFKAQSQTIQMINSPQPAQQISASSVSTFNVFSLIFLNNVKVLMFCLLFSFLYGSGALFILAWNASVIGTAIGNFFRTEISLISPSLAAYFKVSTLALARYFIHGIPEILAYLVAGIAGSLISVAVVNHDFRTRRFTKILDDTADLVIIALFILLIAAFLEVFITPLFFS